MIQINLDAEEWLNILKFRRDLVWDLIEHFTPSSKEYKILEKAADDLTILICGLIAEVNDED